MNPHYVFAILLVAGAVWTAAWGFVVVRARTSLAADVVKSKSHALRRVLFVLFLVTLLVFLVVTLPRFPYYALRVAALGPPADTVSVTGLQWAWTLSHDTVPAGVPVEFDVSALDVNHGFGIYDAAGRILGQVQAMPGYTNKLVYRFTEPGVYTVRCLEYCGVGHHVMLTTVSVVRR